MQKWNSKNTYRSGKQAAQVTRASWLTSLKVKLTQPSQPSLLWEEETCGSNITPVKEAKNKWSEAGQSWISDLIRTAEASEWYHLPPTQATETVQPVVVVSIVLLIPSLFCPAHCTDCIHGVHQQRSGRRSNIVLPAAWLISLLHSLCLSFFSSPTFNDQGTNIVFIQQGRWFYSQTVCSLLSKDWHLILWFLRIIAVWQSENCQKHISSPFFLKKMLECVLSLLSVCEHLIIFLL